MRTNDTDAKAATRAKLKAQELPSRRYICRICGATAWTLAGARLKDPVCPVCEKSESSWVDYYHDKLVEAQEKGYLPDDFDF